MIEKYGFSQMKYEQKINVDGWGRIVDKDRSFGEEDEILNKIRDEFWKRK